MRHLAITYFVASMTLLLTGCGSQTIQPTLTGQGPVQGTVEDGVSIFRGISYAAPPVGDLRWRAPQPAAAWTEVFNASEYGPACWQVTDSGDALFLTALTEGAGMSGFTRWMLTTLVSLGSPNVAED
jgi:para-nitrobenzyl esterase